MKTAAAAHLRREGYHDFEERGTGVQAACLHSAGIAGQGHGVAVEDVVAPERPLPVPEHMGVVLLGVDRDGVRRRDAATKALPRVTIRELGAVRLDEDQLLAGAAGAPTNSTLATTCFQSGWKSPAWKSPTATAMQPVRRGLISPVQAPSAVVGATGGRGSSTTSIGSGMGVTGSLNPATTSEANAAELSARRRRLARRPILKTGERR